MMSKSRQKYKNNLTINQKYCDIIICDITLKRKLCNVSWHLYLNTVFGSRACCKLIKVCWWLRSVMLKCTLVNLNAFY